MAGALRLIRPGEAPVPGAWRVSDWEAGQSSLLRWAPGNVRTWEGGAGFILARAPDGSARPFAGGEVQSVDAAATGTWRWLAQAPRLPSGAVWALFTYRADHDRDPWVEFDWEFLGRDGGDGPAVTKVRLNVHMAEGRAGGRRSLEEVTGGPVIVDLRRAGGPAFDAAGAMHLYELRVTDRDAAFALDGRVILRVDRGDMGGLWRPGPMRGCASLWCVDPALESWGGPWRDPGLPLVGRVAAMGYAPPDERGRFWIRGLTGRIRAR